MIDTTSVRRGVCGAVLAILALGGSIAVRAQSSITLASSASPAAAQPGITTVSVTGSNFPSGTIVPSDVVVTFQPATAGAGPTVSGTPVSIATLVGTTRRVTFVVPSSLSMTSPVPYRVSIAGKTTTAVTFASSNTAGLTINPPPQITSLTPPSAAPGTTVSVAIATTYTNFLQGATQANFGPGISVAGAAEGAFGTITVTSPTTATAQIAVNAAAAGGFRQVSVRTGVQQASVTNVFSVTVANRSPIANPGSGYAGAPGQLLQFDGRQSSDPDGDPLTYAWQFGDGQTGTGPTPTHAYATAGAYTVTLTVDDGRGGQGTATTAAQITKPNTKPTARATGPGTATAGVAAAFHGSDSSDPDGDPITFSWNFGDGTATSSDANPSHTYAQAGTYTATLTVTDSFGAADAATVSTTVKAANRTPTANAGGPYSGVTGAAIAFDGSASSDPDGDALTYSWNFGDGSAAATGVNPTHSYANANTYVVTLTVTDTSGASNAATANATVTTANRTPTANPGGPYSGQTGTAVAFDGSGSSDPDGDTLTYSWNFGDGSAPSTLAAPSHAYTSAGPYVVTLTVQDGRGGQASASTTAQISKANGKPTARASGPSTGDAGATLAFRGADSTDPDGDPLTYSWDFGDGSVKSGQTNPTHAFAQSGPYVVALTVTDSFGASDTATVAVSITVPNHTPTAVPGGPYSGQSGATIGFDGSASSDPDGDALAYSWDFGDGSAKSAAAQPSHSFTAGGNYVVALTVTDIHGASDTKTVVASVTGANQPPTANAGGPYTGESGVAVAIDGSQSSDPDGTALTFSWDFGDGTPKGSGAKPSHVYATTGTFAVSLTVTDPGGLTASASTTATVTTSVDRVPPVVTLTGAKQALPGSQVVVTADAADNVAVSSVTLTVNDADPLSYTVGPYQRTITVPDIAAPGSEIHVHALAKDPSNNEGSADHTITIVAVPDTSKPTVTLTVPPQAAAGSSILVTADAQDNVAVTGVDFSQNTTPIGSAANAPYQVPYVVPADAPLGAVLTFMAQASDAAGNRAQATATLTVVGTGDVDATPPSVTVSAPTPSVSGTSIALTSSAASTSGIASVTFFVDGAKVATAVTPPYQAPYSIATSVAAGTRLHVEAHAVNGLALEASAATDVDVIGPSEGVLTGAVFDDAIGLPVAGANIQLIGTDARGIAYTQTAVSDTRGQYVLKATEGDAIVSISKAGWTRLDRHVTIEHATALHVVDARLTNSGLISSALAAAVGGALAGPGQPFLDIWQRDLLTLSDPYVTALAATGPTVSLTVPAGTLANDATLTLTPVSRQGLAGLLPIGWTPIAAADLAPHGTPFLGPASLAVPLPMKLAAGTPLVLAQWDDDARTWRTVALTTVDASGNSLSAALLSTGQFAWLLADTVPTPPPAATVGDPVPGVDAAVIPTDATAIVDPQPRIIFYKPGVKSDVRGRVTTTAPLSSGTLARTRILESYDFFSGAHMQLDPTLEDVVLYQVPGTDGKTLVAGYPVAPSLTFEALSLQKGIITVELRAPGARQESVQLINETGGGVAASTGERIDVAAGAMAGPLPVTISALTTAEVGVGAPDGFEIVGAVLLDFANVLAAPASLSVPRAAQVQDGDLIVVARMQELIGQTRFVTVGLGSIASDRISSITTLTGSAATFDGVRVPGRYVFLRATAPVAFSTGLVLGTDAAPFPGAVISTTPTSALVSASQATGRYIAVIPVGGSTLTARNPIMGDSASGAANATVARQVVTLDFALVAHFPTVTSVNPANGADGVPLSGPIVVTFSSPIDPATATAASITLASSAGAVAGRREISNGNTVVTFRSTDALSPNTVYTLTVTQAVTDPFGRALTTQFATSFTSLNTVAPPPPPAGSLSASIPTNGNTTVTVSQGAAGSKDTVVIRNVTRNTFTPISVVDPSVGFTVQVAALFTDKLQLVIRDRSGNETVVDLPAFRTVNADGSVSTAVTSDGGHVDGPAGIGIDVPSGAFPSGTVITLKPVTEAQFPIPLTVDQRQFFSFTGGFQLDLGGQTPASGYLNVSLPTQGNETIDDQWIVGVVSQVGGQQLLQVADTAHVINGRIATSSPPCPGVTGSGIYGFLKAARPMGVVYGRGPVADPAALESAYAQAIVDIGAAAPLEAVMPGSAATLFGADMQAIGALSQTFCLPLLASRLTATPNRVGFTAPAGVLKATDRKLVIRNLNTNAETKFFPPWDNTFSVEGSNADAYAEIVSQPDTSTRQVNLTLVPRSYVVATVAASDLFTTDREITIKNTTRGTAFSSGLTGNSVIPIYTVSAIIEGTAADTYEASVIDANGAPRPVTATIAPYTLGNGALLLRALPGTVDPTHDEIVAFNATVPPAQQVPVNGVTRVEVFGTTASGTPLPTEVLLDNTSSSGVVVGGGFIHAVNGSIDNKYELHVTYENGNVEVLRFPSFHVTVQTPSGTPLKNIVGFVPPRGEPMFIDVDLGGPQPTVNTPSGAFTAMDPRAPLTFVLSQALNAASVTAHLALFKMNPTGPPVQVNGTWVVSDDGKSVTFLPKETLAFGTTYRIDFNGVTTASGLDVPVSSVPVSTFAPLKLGSEYLPNPHLAVGGGHTPTTDALPFTDFEFVKSIVPPTGQKSLLVASSGNATGFKFHDIDVSDARAPVEAGHTAGGRPKRLTMVNNIVRPLIDIEYDVPLVPQQSKMSCWAASTAMLVGWRDQVSFNPGAIADPLSYEHQYFHGLAPFEVPDLFTQWGLVSEPLTSLPTVQTLKTLLENYGALWVGGAVPTGHVRVVTGLVGDGTPDGTMVQINDPWDVNANGFSLPNSGSVYQETVTEFLATQDLMAHRLFFDATGVQSFCDIATGPAKQDWCQLVNKPNYLTALGQCAVGDAAACTFLDTQLAAACAAGDPYWCKIRDLFITRSTGVLIGHLPSLPPGVTPYPPSDAGLTLQGGTGLQPNEQPDTTRIMQLVAGENCAAHVAIGPTGQPTFAGNLLVASLLSNQGSSIGFYDVTDPNNPCMIGDKPLTRTPESLPPAGSGDYSAKGTIKGTGFANGVAVLQTTTGYAAYVAVAELGLMAVDVGKNIPSQYAFYRQVEGIYSGDYVDVAAVNGRLVALNNNSGGDPSLDVLDGSLGLQSSTSFTLALNSSGINKVHQLKVARRVFIDKNKNGSIDDGEVLDLAFVAGSNGVTILDITDLDNISPLGVVPMPGIVRELAVSKTGRVLLAGGDTSPSTVNGMAFYIIDVSDPTISSKIDKDNDGLDDRIAFQSAYPHYVDALRIDDDRDLAYVGSDIAVDIWAISRRGAQAFNHAPVANAGPDQGVVKKAHVTLDGHLSSDPDGDPLGYSWTQIGGDPVTNLTGTNTAAPSFDAPDVEGATLTFQLTVNDGINASAPDTVVITTKTTAQLKLRPVIVPFITVPATSQLNLSFDPGDGTGPTDVTADPKVEYRWIGHGLTGGLDKVPDITAIINALAAKLGIPVQLADISVSATGAVTANTQGLQLVRAHYKDGTTELDSNVSLIIGGIKLKDITLRPDSPITTLLGELTSALGSKKNPPMILVTDANGYIFDKGLVTLEDVEFSVAGAATISIADLLDTVKPAIEAELTVAIAEVTAPLGPVTIASPILAAALTKLVGMGIAYAGTQALNPLESADQAIATVSDQAPFKGWVQSHASGLTSISGTLDLGPLGKADDSVLAWVLPTITSATIEPNVTVIRRTDPPTPGPAVRTFVEVTAIAQAVVQLSGAAESAAELLDRFLPDGIASWQTGIDKTFTIDVPAPHMKFHVKGSVAPACVGPDASGEMQCSVTLSNVGLGFYAPNTLHPLLDNDYTIGQPVIPDGDPTIAAIGAREFVDTHIVHQNKVGVTGLTGTVSIPFMGSATDTTARIVVNDGGPVLLKIVAGKRREFLTGSAVEFQVSVTNPFDQPMTNVQVTDTLHFTPQASSTEGVIQTFALPPIASLDAHQTVWFKTVPTDATDVADSRLTVAAPGVAGTLRNEVTATGSAPSSASVAVVDATLQLTPELIPFANAPGSQQLTVTLVQSTGPPQDVTRDAVTTYSWIGSGVPQGVVDAIYAKINAALAAEGQPPIPAQIANISVDPLTGILTVNSNGLQLVQATHDKLKSNVALVLAGVKLKKIVLEPLSKLNTLQSALVTLNKPPMFLASDAPGNDGFLDTVGQVLLTDARFEILGGPATISVKDLVDALSSAASDAVTAYTAETGPLAKVFGWAAKVLLTGLIDEAGTQLLDPVTSTEPSFATVVDKNSASILGKPIGRVDALLPGITDVKGTLDLGDYGKASDNVFTWVLPALTSAVIEPHVVAIDLSQTPPADPKVRTFARLNFGGSTPLPLSGKFNDVAEAINGFLAGGWAGSGFGTFSLSTGRVQVSSPVDNFTFSLDAGATVACAQPGADESGCTVQVNSLTFGFQVPHVPPFITDTYVTDTAIATTSLDANTFDTHVQGVAVGRSKLESHVDMSALKMGQADDLTGLVIVVQTPVPPPVPPPQSLIIEKQILGGLFALTPGQTAQFAVLVANPTATELTNVTLTDTVTINGVPGTPQPVVIGTLAPNEGRVVPLPAVVAPASGTVQNDISLSGGCAPCSSVIVPVRRPLINELVVQPQQDWDDSGGGGNGISFDNMPGTATAPNAAVTVADQWIEILTNTGSPDELKNWTLQFVDTTGTPVSMTLNAANVKTAAGSPYAVIGAPTGGIAPGSVVSLVDTTGTVVDSVNLATVTAAIGPATGVGDEAIARHPDGVNTGNPASDFKRQPATIGATNP